ncbi:hypothetical protein BCR42DRAFT_418982 [Absidia repens]|uniref:Uncharacterized protein n=1 Tax=Absidia repens TaxID=90262 RepID=A0A1X2ICB0_9FUNG|nr:hypothetical protein BCR42DRAFT_418982 [Absidia repens]
MDFMPFLVIVLKSSPSPLKSMGINWYYIQKIILSGGESWHLRLEICVALTLWILLLILVPFWVMDSCSNLLLSLITKRNKLDLANDCDYYSYIGNILVTA